MLRFTFVSLLILSAAPVAFAQPARVRVLILDGQNNHNWRATTPVLKAALEKSGRFTVKVSSNLKPNDKPGSVVTVPFPPDLAKYDVVVSNYNGQPWPKEFQQAFDEAVKSGKLGLDHLAIGKADPLALVLTEELVADSPVSRLILPPIGMHLPSDFRG